MMALVFAMVMLVAMSVSTFAATYSISNSSSKDVVTGHTYKAYQIFKADSINDGKLGNIAWADNVSAEAKAALLNGATLESLIETLGSAGNDTTTATDFAKKAFANKNGLGTNQDITSASTVLDLGYWLIVDESSADDVDVINWANLYQSDGTTAVAVVSKVDAPSSEKKVQDINDSDATPALSDLQDSADYEIGDTIPYTLTFTLPGNYADYETYYVKFKDTLSEGLTYNGDAKIHYGATDTAGSAINFGSGQDLAFEIADLKTNAGSTTLRAGDVISITYTCYLNRQAKTLATGNPNTYSVEYSNNPNKSGDGDNDHGETPEDKNIVFTYKTIFNKVDENNQALEGADFKLEKKVNGEWVDVTSLGDSAHPQKIGSSSEHSTEFSFVGLDDGDYRLTETTTPEGYNTIEPITFTITANHIVTSDNPTLESLEGAEGTEFEMTSNKADGSLTASVENKSGAVLPSTGGIGTTIFYVVGAVLVLGAAILLVAKRRVER